MKIAFVNPFMPSKKDVDKALSEVTLTARHFLIMIMVVVPSSIGFIMYEKNASYEKGYDRGKCEEQLATKEIKDLYAEATKQVIKYSLEKQVQALKDQK